MDNQRETGNYQELTLAIPTSQDSISHRALSPAEARTIWTIFNPTANFSSMHELRIVLKSEHVNGARGWVICTE